MAPEPLVSVVLPVHNGQRYLAQAIESVLRQDHRSVELIIVDDASSDRSREIAQAYGRAVTYRRVAKQTTSIATTNAGVLQATGDYVCVLHQDDFLLPGKLRKHVEVMEHHRDVGLSYSAEVLVGPDGEPLATLRSPLRRGSYVVDGRTELWHLATGNYLNYCNVIMRRSALAAVRPFDDPLWVSADWAMWLRLALRYRVAYLDDALVCYRIHPKAQTLTSSHDPDEWARQAWVALDEFLAEPALPQHIRARQHLAVANIYLSSGLLHLIRRRWRDGATSLLHVARLASWRLPQLVYSSAIIPRSLARLRMFAAARKRGTASATQAGTLDATALVCPVCGAVGGYPIGRGGSEIPASLRCVACGATWRVTAAPSAQPPE